MNYGPSVLSIRERRRSDLDRCVEALAVVHHADGYPLNWPADPRGWLCPGGSLPAWIAEGPDGTPAGHLALSQVDSAAVGDLPVSGATASISRFFVVPAFRRQAVGQRLLAQAQKWAGSQGLDLVLDVVDDARSSAVALYEATGWQLSHLSRADWTGPGGEPVRLRHYRRPPS